MSLFPNKAMDATDANRKYFDSKLFRGVSKPNSKPLQALSQLSDLKRNPKTHSLSFKELDTNLQATRSPKNFLLGSLLPSRPTTASARKTSLHPSILTQSVPKKPTFHKVTAEQRIRMIDHYLEQTEKNLIEQPLNSLDLLWQHTLSNPHENDEMNKSRDFKDLKQNMGMQTCGKMGLPEIGELLAGNQSNFSVDNLTTDGSKVDTFFKKGAGSDSSYGILTRNIEYFTNTLKDFYKIVTYSQKYYQKATLQQQHLYNFVMTFTSEVDEIERMPTKETSEKRLQLCVNSVENKIIQLTNESELIQEQNRQILNLAAAAQMAQTDPFQIRLELGNNTAQKPKLRTSYSEVKLSRNFTPQRTIREEEESESKAQQVIERLKARTEEIKNDVKKLVGEREDFENEGSRILPDNDVSVPSSDNERVLNLIDHEDGPSSYREMVANSKKNQSLNALHINEPSPVYKFYRGSNVGFADIPEDSLEEDIYGNSPIVRAHGEELAKGNRKAEAVFHSAAKLYQFYKTTLSDLESRVGLAIQDTKLFQKDFDDLTSPQNMKLLIMQINFCFENLLSEFQLLTKDFKTIRLIFLNEISEYFKILGEINESNLMKLAALNELFASSFKKLRKIAKHCSKYTKYDLTDKPLRKKYEEKLAKLKNSLNKDRKTLMFLADQFKKPFPLSKLGLIVDPNPNEVENLVEESRTFTRVLYNLEKFPQLEHEFSEKSTKAYEACRASTDIIDALKDFLKTQTRLSVERYKEGEEMVRNLGTLSVKVVALKNEFEMISKLHLFANLVRKPLEITLKLVKKMEINQNELKDLLTKIRTSLLSEYEQVVSDCDELENQLNTHLRRLVTTHQHLEFGLWHSNFSAIENLQVRVTKVSAQLNKFLQDIYPPSIVLIPKPYEKHQHIKSFELRVSCLMKTLEVGKLLEPQQFCAYFEEITSTKFTYNLKSLADHIDKHIDEQQGVLLLLEKESEVLKRITSDVITVLAHIRLVFIKIFDLETHISYFYEAFEKENQIPETIIHQMSKERKLSANIVIEDNFDKYEKSSRSIPMIDQEQEVQEYPQRLAMFISKLKTAYKSVYEEVLIPFLETHNLYALMYDYFNTASGEEINQLETIQMCVMNIQTNAIFYNKEIKPILKIYKYFLLTNRWGEKVTMLRLAKENMEPFLNSVKRYETLQGLRGGVEPHIKMYSKLQEILSHSLDMVIDLFLMGNFLSEKEIKATLATNVRVDKGSYEGFLIIIERRYTEINKKYEVNHSITEYELGIMIEKLDKFLKKIIHFIRNCETHYKTLCKKTNGGLAPYGKDILLYIDDCYQIVTEMAEESTKTIGELEVQAERDLWILNVLRDYYQEIMYKDLKLFEKLKECLASVMEATEVFKTEFIDKEVINDRKYKTIAHSDPNECERKTAYWNEIYQNLSSFAIAEEVTMRPELKTLLQEKIKHVSGVRRILTTFGAIYAMNKKINEGMVVLMPMKNVNNVFDHCEKMENILNELIKHTSKLIEDTKGETKIDFGVDFHLEIVLKDDVLDFYVELKNWFKEVRESITTLTSFNSEIKRRFKTQVFLLRDDWANFVKEALYKDFLQIKDKIAPVREDYEEMFARTERFIDNLETEIMIHRAALLDILSKVDYLNQSFFLEGFFNTQEEREYADKVLPLVIKMIRDLKYEHFAPDKLKLKLARVLDNVNTSYQNYDELVNGGSIHVYMDGIYKFSQVEAYMAKHNVKYWPSLLQLVMKEMIFEDGEEKAVKEFLGQYPNYERLLQYFQKDHGIHMNALQREFLECMYAWVKQIHITS